MMRTRVIAAAIVVLGVAVPAVGAAAVGAFHSTVSTRLTARSEVPKGAPGGSGTAVVKFNTKTSQACWTLKVNGLDKTLSAHVHKAPPGKNGPVVIPLGARFAPTGCVRIPMKTLRAVGSNPAGYYVNVHTRKYLNGAIRGQLHG
jgi:hypothetical protein